MSNEKKKVVTNLDFNIKLLNRNGRYETYKKDVTPTLKNKDNGMKLSYNLLPANKMPTLKMVMYNARRKRG